MSENINFIPANELPVAEGEQVEVLCLEGGELKRKHADGLGGGADVVIAMPYGDAPGVILKGGYDALLNKVTNKNIPDIKVYRTNIHISGVLGDTDSIPFCETAEVSAFVYDTVDGKLVFCIDITWGYTIRLFADNTMKVYENG